MRDHQRDIMNDSVRSLPRQALATPQFRPDPGWRIVFVSNMHCSSCVCTIEETLSSLSPRPSHFEVSIISQSITLRLPDGLSMESILVALDETGFDVMLESSPALTTSTTCARIALTHAASTISALLSNKKQKHADQCLLCSADPEASEHDSSGFHAGSSRHNPRVPLAASPPASARIQELPLTSRRDVSGSPADPTAMRELSLSIGGMTCASCANSIARALHDVQGVRDVSISVLSHSGTCTVMSSDLSNKVVEAIEDCGFEAEIVDVRPVLFSSAESTPRADDLTSLEGPYIVLLSVGGMTCASCSNAITDALESLDGVSDAHVNLLSNSASVTLSDRKYESFVLGAIEDIGYEADVIGRKAIIVDMEKAASNVITRAVSLHVDGLFCLHCPENVMHALQPMILDRQLTVVKPLDFPTNNILQVEYIPSCDVNIRTIIRAVASSKPSEGSQFQVSIFKPPTLEERARHMYQREQRMLLHRLLFAVVTAIPTFIIGIVYMSLLPRKNATRMWFMSTLWIGRTSRLNWALFFLATPVYFYSCGIFHRRSLKELRALWRRGSRVPIWKRFIRFGSMNLLVSSGVTVAYVSSIVLLALAATQTPVNTMDGDMTTYFDSVVFLTMFLLLGRFLEAWSKSKTSDAITALGKLRPTTALLLVPNSDISLSSTPRDIEKAEASVDHSSSWPGHAIQKIGAELLEAGDIVRVPQGSSPPADGIVVGRPNAIITSFDESSLTGESKLVSKQAGDEVFLGTINKGEAVDIRIKSVGGDSMLDHIVKVVREGQINRAPIERVADQITAYFVPIITLLAILTWTIWLALGLGGVLPPHYLDIGLGGWPIWSLEFAIAVFVVACPCGIGLAAPTALLVGSGLAAKYGILARGGGEAFQDMAQLDMIVFDKTGTLTEGGAPRVTNAEIFPSRASLSRSGVLGVASALESASSHPLAAAIRWYCEQEQADFVEAYNFEEVSGRGLKAHIEGVGSTAIIGNEAWMIEHGATIPSNAQELINSWKNEAKSVVLLALSPTTEGQFYLAAAFAIADVIRPEAKSVIASLKKQNIAVWMISGDNIVTAKAVARLVGIEEANIIADVLPHEKAQKVQWLQQVGTKRRMSWIQRLARKQDIQDRCVVAFTGDGINDSPALTVADVGIAMGSGSDVALSSASFVLISSDLRGLVTLYDLSRKVLARVKMNFAWALVYNFAALPIAAGVIYPAGHARLAPVWASLTMALSSISVVCSSLLLKLFQPRRHT